jgi:uncharacterized membrane protein required for colicin V production
LNIIDWIIILLLIGGLAMGYSRGLIRQAVHLASFIAAYILAFKFYDDFAPKLMEWIPLSQFEEYNNFSFVAEALQVDRLFYNAVAFALIFFGTKMGLSLVGNLLHIVASLPGLSILNRWGGLLLGFLEVAFILIIAVNVMAVLPWQEGNQLLAESLLGSYLVENVPVIAKKLQELWLQTGGDSI